MGWKQGGWKIGRRKYDRKYCFLLFDWGRKIGETKNMGENFPPWAHFFYTNTPFLFSHTVTNTTATNTIIFFSNISKLKHNQIIRIQIQKHNFKINQIITIKGKKRKKRKKEKKKTEDRRQKPSDPSRLCWGWRWVMALGWANCFGTKMTHLDYIGDECSGIK